MSSSIIDVGSLTTCAICLETYESPTRLGCHHIFCRACWDATRKCKPACPMCRKPQSGPGAPDVVMNQLVMQIPITRPCGDAVAKSKLSTHEDTCVHCASVTKRELNHMVQKLARRIVFLNNNLMTVHRNLKRARDESVQHHKEAQEYHKRLRANEMRTRRRMFRETCVCGDCGTWEE